MTLSQALADPPSSKAIGQLSCGGDGSRRKGRRFVDAVVGVSDFTVAPKKPDHRRRRWYVRNPRVLAVVPDPRRTPTVVRWGGQMAAALDRLRGRGNSMGRRTVARLRAVPRRGGPYA